MSASLAAVEAAAPEWEVVHGDCLEVLRTLPDACVDAIVTDPPAGIGFMGKGWDSDRGGRDQWIAWLASVMRECLRVLKPGGHALVWALPRTSHWTGTAIELAGFEVRDRLSHFFGTGFPKSLDVGKAIDKSAGAEREAIGKIARPASTVRVQTLGRPDASGSGWQDSPDITAPATPEAARWDGWGTALKPACEDWWLARKPLEGTVAANVLAHGTGGLNIDASRIGTSKETPASTGTASGMDGYGLRNGRVGKREADGGMDPNIGRWPSNILLSHSEDCADACAPGCPVAELDAQSGIGKDGKAVKHNLDGNVHRHSGFAMKQRAEGDIGYGGSGGASRFFYVAKPSASERDAGLEHLAPKSGGEATGRVDGSDGLKSPRAGAGRNGNRKNVHPTVKSIALMRWLVRLITPPGGTVLDPFCGSGTTGCAAVLEGASFLGLEREEEYAEIARARIAHWATKGASQ